MLRKYLRPFLQGSLSLLLGSYILLIFALDSSGVQHYLGEQVAKQLEAQLQTEVEIGKVEVGLLNSLHLHDVLIKDRLGNLLLKSGLMRVNVEPFSLLEGKIALSNLALLDTQVQLYKPSAKAPLNLQFLLEQFKSDTPSETPLNVRINSLILRRCQLRYDEWHRSMPKKGEFSPHHLNIQDIDANISLKILTTDSLNLRLRHLSAREACGLQLRNLRLRIAANRKEALLQDFLLLTSSSRVEQERIVARYDATLLSRIASTLQMEGTVCDARISTRDVQPFLPQLKQVSQILHLNTHYAFSPRKISFSQFRLQSHTEAIAVEGNFSLSRHKEHWGRLQAEQVQLSLREHLAASLYSAFLQHPYPSLLRRLGHFSLRGKGHYDLLRGNAFEGEIYSAIGTLKAQLTQQNEVVAGKISSLQLAPARLAEHPWLPEKMNFELEGKVHLNQKFPPDGHIHLTLKEVVVDGKSLKDVELTAQLQQQQAQLSLHSNDPNAVVKLESSAKIAPNWEVSHLKLNAQVGHFVPAIWGLTTKWGNGAFAFTAQAESPHLSLEKPEGKLSINQLSLTNDGQLPPYRLNHLQLLATTHPYGSHLRLRSDFADLDFSGSLSPKELRASLLNQLAHFAQKVSPSPRFFKPLPVNSPRASFALRLYRNDFLQRIAQLNLSFPEALQAEGTLSTSGEQMRITLHAPQLKVGDVELEGISIALRHDKSQFSLIGKGQKHMKDKNLAFEVLAQNHEEQLHTDVQWRELNSSFFYGKLETRTNLTVPQWGDAWRFTTEILPTSFTIYGNTWNVLPSKVQLADGRLSITRFTLSHSDQMVAITGEYGEGSEGLSLALRKVDVGIINLLTGLDVVTFKGRASGRGRLQNNPEEGAVLTAELDIPNFHFNNSLLGHAQIKGAFELKEQNIRLEANMVNGPDSETLVKGEIGLGRERIDLQVEGTNTPIDFLNHYITDIFHNIRGHATGKCRVFGPFQAIDFEGYERATASLHVPIVGVTYHAHDAEVDITPGCFRLRQAQITDSLQGSGSVQGLLHHKHLLDMDYDFAITGQHIKLYDKPYEVEMPFYATAYGTGDVRITGDAGQMKANISLVTEPGSVLTYILDQPDAADQQLLSLKARVRELHVDTMLAERTQNKTNRETKTDIRLNMEVDVRPTSTLRMITDIKSGDVITVHGGGPIQANYYNKGDFQMFGTYTIERGHYDLSIQNIIRKRFTLLPNGTVEFSGSPLDANVNVHASYLVNSASLSDLNIGHGFSNNTTPVNCLIDFSGKVSNMQLALDFDLPNVGEDEKAMVRQLIASDEDRTMQVLYLLGVGRFYTYNYASTQSGTQQSQSEVMMKSLLASTLSSQLTNILSNALGTNNWSLGANVSTGQLGWNDMEIDGLLSGRLLNNRLQVNGKIGYHEREAATTNFVGDFDVHYLLTPTGTVSLKAYSETNDRYFSKSTLTTQGVGIQLKRESSSFLELFRRKRKSQTKTK